MSSKTPSESEWAVDNKAREAMDPHGYRITWAKLPTHGKMHFNAWSPSGAHIGAGFDREILKAVCGASREAGEIQP